MRDLISILKNIPPDALIYKLSELSIEMFKRKEVTREFEKPTTIYGIPSTSKTMLLLWDIPYIEYLCICNSNDYRRNDKKVGLDVVTGLFRIYENEHSAGEDIRDADYYGLMRILTGMSAEQFMFDDLRWIFQLFNRNYYILMTLQKACPNPLVDVDSIVNRVFGFGADEYMNLLIVIIWLCMQHPDPLSAPEALYKKKGNTILTKENISQIVRYYSSDYDTIRSHPLKKQQFYAKPFICTNRSHLYISASFHLVLMTLGNGLYWVLRNYYSELKSQEFVNAFGRLFELYIIDISNRFCTNNEFREIETKSHKTADFIYEFTNIRILVEAKSALLGVEGKQQVPKVSPIDNFIERNIRKAYNQLSSTYKNVMSGITDSKTTIKVIMLYDVFSNAAMIEHAAEDILKSDSSCFVITIRELEIILMLYHEERSKFDQIVHLIEESIHERDKRRSITYIFDKLKLWKYDFFKGEYDCFHSLLARLKNETTL